jgi:hypothetical protein
MVPVPPPEMSPFMDPIVVEMVLPGVLQ